jgi:tRNA A-37 threonylcarbamoyl transferase component Bud32
MVKQQFPVMFGKYVLLSRIGTGGMAEVFLARNTASGEGGKRIVLKRMLAVHNDDQSVRDEFLNEARLMSLFMHPNVIEVMDFGEQDSFPFIVMEFIHGRDLATVIETASLLKVPLPEDVTFYVVSELLEGLAAVHAAADHEGKPLEIVHGDVNPANIFVSFAGEVKLGDFGIAKTNVERKNKMGVMKGKLGYLAPEQIEKREADPRTDIFAAGIVLWEMLAARRLFAGKDDYEVLSKVVEAKIPPVTRNGHPLPPALDRILAKALAKDPKKRYQRAVEFATALSEYVAAGRYRTNFQMLQNYMGALFAEQLEEERRALDESKKYTGRIEERSLVKVVADLIREKASGRLHVERENGDVKNFFFRNGVVYFCTSNLPEELLGEFMVAEGTITREQLNQGLRHMKHTAGKLGDALMALKVLAPHTLLATLQRQVKAKVTQSFSWTTGSYSFHHGERCHEEALPLDIGTVSLVAEGIRRHMAQEHLEAAMNPFLFMKPVFRFTPDFDVETLSLNSRELRVYRALSGEKTLNDLIGELTEGGKFTARDVLALPYLLYEMGVLSFE